MLHVLLLYKIRMIYQVEAKVATELFPGDCNAPNPSRIVPGVASGTQQASLKNILKCLYYCEMPTDILGSCHKVWPGGGRRERHWGTKFLSKILMGYENSEQKIVGV